MHRYSRRKHCSWLDFAWTKKCQKKIVTLSGGCAPEARTLPPMTVLRFFLNDDLPKTDRRRKKLDILSVCNGMVHNKLTPHMTNYMTID